MNFKHQISLLVISVLLFNCSSGGDDPSSPDPNPNPTAVTYNGDIKSIISNNCISCHGSPTANGAPMSLTSYSQVKSYVDKIITRINSSSNPMPTSPNSPLSASDKNLIQQWKDDGLLEN
jgi:uncharacterized membrane protein